MASLTSSKDVLSSGSIQNPDSFEVGSDRRLSSSLLNASSSMDHTLGSEISKTSKLTSSSPDCNIKSSSVSNGSSRAVRPQAVAFNASVYDEITPVVETRTTASQDRNQGTTPDLTEREKECITTLMHLLATKNHPDKQHPSDEVTATKFLMARKFDLVRAWSLYESHLQRRRKYKLDCLDPHEQPLRGELSKNKFVFLGTRDKLDRAIALFEAKKHISKESNPLTVMQALSLHLDHALFNTSTQRQGLILIYDMSGSGLKNLDYELAKELLDFLQEAYPARLHRTYVLNAPLLFRAAVRFFAPFLKAKVLQRLELVSLGQLHAYLPSHSLPESLGGTLKFSYEQSLELCIDHWLTHPFNSIPDLSISTKPATDSVFSDENTNREHFLTRPPLPPKRVTSEIPPNAFTPITDVTDRIFSMPDTPSSVDPVDQLVYHRQVPVLDDGDYQMTLEHLRAYMGKLGKRGLEEEYMKLRNIQPEGSFTNSVVPYNIVKNRYRDVLTFDHSRVKLRTINIEADSDPHDYINANHIDSYNSPGAFIMCQGPIPNTVGDFWRMVWEQNVLTIVMVTRCTEGNKLKCAQYWPEMAEGEIKFNGVYVKPIDETPSRGYVIRRFTVRTTDTDTRDLTHFQYIAWPDYGVPANGDEVLHLMDSVQEEQIILTSKHFPNSEFTSQSGPPILVHCSAGIGRSGTFCSIHSLLHQYHATGMVSVQGTIRKLRRQRAYSIQAPEQYSFIYASILEHMEKNPAGHADIPLPQMSVDGGATD